jgi:hypothetical protein
MKQLLLIPLIFCAGCVSSPEPKTQCSDHIPTLEVLDVMFATSMNMDLKHLRASLKWGYSYAEGPLVGVVCRTKSGQGVFFSFFDLNNPYSFTSTDDDSIVVTGVCLFDDNKDDLINGKFIYPVSVRGKTYSDFYNEVRAARKDPEKVKAYEKSEEVFFERLMQRLSSAQE